MFYWHTQFLCIKSNIKPNKEHNYDHTIILHINNNISLQNTLLKYLGTLNI